MGRMGPRKVHIARGELVEAKGFVGVDGEGWECLGWEDV